MVKGEQIIDLLERFILNSDEERDQMGIELKLNYAYKRMPIRIEYIRDVKPYKRNKTECIVYFVGGGNTVCYGNADELFIRINDLRNNEMEDNVGY